MKAYRHKARKQPPKKRKRPSKATDDQVYVSFMCHYNPLGDFNEHVGQGIDESCAQFASAASDEFVWVLIGLIRSGILEPPKLVGWGFNGIEDQLVDRYGDTKWPLTASEVRSLFRKTRQPLSTKETRDLSNLMGILDYNTEVSGLEDYVDSELLMWGMRRYLAGYLPKFYGP